MDKAMEKKQMEKVRKQILESGIIQKGKKQGYLTHEELDKVLDGVELDDKMKENLCTTLASLDIDFVESKEAKGAVKLSGKDDDDIDVEDIDKQVKESEDEEESPVSNIDTSAPKNINIDDPVRMYLKEIGKIPLLKPHEEVECAKRMSEGDELAKAKLEEANLRLVVSLSLIHI